MGDRQDANLVSGDGVDQRIGKARQRPSPFSVAPDRPQAGMLQQLRGRALEILEQGERQRVARAFAIELCCLPKILPGLRMQPVSHRYLSLSAAKVSGPGSGVAAPLSIS